MFKKKIYSNNLFFLRYMPNLNLWQKIYSKTKYKRSKSDCVITIGFGLVFLFWKDRKFTEILLFIFSLNALKILAFQVSYFVFFLAFLGSFVFHEVCILEYSADRGKGTFIPVFIWSTHTDVSLWSCSYLWNYR